MGRTMDLNELGGVPGGTSGAVGAIMAAIGGAIWLVRKVLRNDRVEGARSQAETDIIERLQDMLDKANARADIEAQRADLAYKERNEALRLIGSLEAKVSALETEIRMMREQFYGKDSALGGAKQGDLSPSGARN